MPSSLIDELTDTLVSTDGTPRAVTDSDRRGLLAALAEVPDPRRRRGVRYSCVSLLAVAVCAVLAGATSFAAISDWLEDLPEIDLPLLGLDRRPTPTTLWRLLVRIDSAVLSTVLARWLLARAGNEPAAASGPRVVAIDGKTLRGSRTATEAAVHVLAAYDTATGITLAQIRVDDKGGEIAQVNPLIERARQVLGPLTGVVFTADALHAQTAHAQLVTHLGAGLLVTVKGNQPTLHAQLRTVPWHQVPVAHRTHDRGHGRTETRTVKTLTIATPAGLNFPHTTQAVRITRTRTIAGRTSRETAYLVATAGAGAPSGEQLAAWARSHWHIENRLHHVKDVTLREDACRARIGEGPAVLAVLRNTAIGYQRTTGEQNIARATRRATRRSSDLIHDVIAA
jgi:predicted transposase YbfD/YdcC